MASDNKFSSQSEARNKKKTGESRDSDELILDENSVLEAAAAMLEDGVDPLQIELELVRADLEQAQEDLEKAKAEASDNWDSMLRANAELDNTRRRLEKDVENAHKYGIERFVQGLIPVMDSLEMGLAASREEGADIEKLREGSELTLKMFADASKKFGVETIDPIDQEFNPEFHQAMAMQETADKKPNTVLAVMQKGYTLSGRLVRPAMVVVSKAVSPTKPEEANGGEPGNEADASKGDSVTDSGQDSGADKIGTKIDEKA